MGENPHGRGRTRRRQRRAGRGWREHGRQSPHVRALRGQLLFLRRDIRLSGEENWKWGCWTPAKQKAKNAAAT